MALDASVLIGDGGSDDFYFVAPSMLNHHVVLPRLRKVTIATVYTWPGGAVSLWPVPNVEETRIACWKSRTCRVRAGKAAMGATLLEQRHARLRCGGGGRDQHRAGLANRQDIARPVAARVRRQDHRQRRSIPMSNNSAGLPTSFDRFREIWNHDFEFRQDGNHCPVPVAMFAKEHRTGAEITMDRAQLLASTRAPFDTGPDTLVTSYSIVAELSCFRLCPGQCRKTCCAPISKPLPPSTVSTSLG